MKTVIALLCLLAVPVAAEAQTKMFLDDHEHKKTEENFTASVDLRGQHFVYANMPNRLLDDYTDYHHVPGQQMDVLVRSDLIWNLTMDVEVYAWIGENQWISRIGLIGEAKWQTPIDWISVGYGHHSWHNIDVDVAEFVGHQQDWVLLRVDMPKIRLDGDSYLRVSAEPYYFVANKSPLLEKQTYGPGEEYATWMLAMPIVGVIHDFNFQIKPYVQFGPKHERYGISAEFVQNFTPFFAGFVSAEWYNVDGVDRGMIGIGIMLRLKR